MKALYIEGTAMTPEIILNPESGQFDISGKSIPENPYEFYKPVLDWLEEYKKNPNKVTVVNIKLDYFNTTSTECLYRLFKLISSIRRSDNTVTINWFYINGDTVMYDSGEDFQEIMEFSFNMISYSK